jgi:hypothetical protein
MPDLRTRRGVELVRTGRYELSTGWHEFTRDDLAAIVAGAQGATTPPRVKIGHQDPRFDGGPSLGTVTNVRLADQGDLVLGDLEGVPGWLDDALPHAYPGRSIEASVRDDGTIRLQALALLGQSAPAIDTLADLEMALAAAAQANPDALDVKNVAVALNQLRASAQDPAASRPDNERNHPMDALVLKALAAKYGLNPDEATEEQVNAAILAEPQVTITEPAPVAVTEPVIEVPAEPAAVVTEPVVEEEPALALAASAAIQTLSTEVAELRAAAAAREASETVERRDLLASAWLAEGRITLSEKPHYRGLLDIDEDGTRSLVAALAPGRVPVAAPATTHSLAAATGSEATTTGWFPRLNQEA